MTHLTSLVLPKANSFFMIAVTAFANSWDSFFIIAVTAFADSWDSLFRIAVTTDPTA